MGKNLPPNEGQELLNRALSALSALRAHAASRADGVSPAASAARPRFRLLVSVIDVAMATVGRVAREAIETAPDPGEVAR